jgi:hypothetical protein
MLYSLSLESPYVSDLLAVGAVVGALTVIVRTGWLTRPFRHVWRTSVANPLEEWFHCVVSEATKPMLEQFQQNGGSSLRDSVDRIEARLVDIESQLNATAEQAEDTESRLHDHLSISASRQEVIHETGVLIEEYRDDRP